MSVKLTTRHAVNASRSREQNKSCSAAYCCHLNISFHSSYPQLHVPVEQLTYVGEYVDRVFEALIIVFWHAILINLVAAALHVTARARFSPRARLNRRRRLGLNAKARTRCTTWSRNKRLSYQARCKHVAQITLKPTVRMFPGSWSLQDPGNIPNSCHRRWFLNRRSRCSRRVCFCVFSESRSRLHALPESDRTGLGSSI